MTSKERSEFNEKFIVELQTQCRLADELIKAQRERITSLEADVKELKEKLLTNK